MSHRRHDVLLSGATLLLVLYATAARAEDASEQNKRSVVERFTAKRFELRREIGGEPHVLVGVGARRAGDMVNVYGAAFYVGVEAAATQWRGQASAFAEFRRAGEGYDFDKLRTSPAARRFLVHGWFPKALELVFVRDVTARLMSAEFEDGWTRARLDRAAAGDALERFNESVGHAVASGESLLIRSSVDHEIWVQSPRSTTQIHGNRELIRALWTMWLGNPCIQESLRDGLMSRLVDLHALLGS